MSMHGEAGDGTKAAIESPEKTDGKVVNSPSNNAPDPLQHATPRPSTSQNSLDSQNAKPSRSAEKVGNGGAKIVQLISPDVHRDSIVELDQIAPVLLTTAGGGYGLVADPLASTSSLIREPLSGPSSDVVALPPAVLGQIIQEPTTEYIDLVGPIINGRLARSMSVTDDGLIRLKDYKLSFDLLGAGKLSEVRIATHTKENKKYAIKIFSRAKLQKFSMLLKSSRSPVDDPYREAEFLRNLEHPNVIKMKELIDEPEDENIFLVLELLDKPVVDTPTDDPLSERQAQKYFLDVLEGLSHIHSCGVVHRDIKPENLLINLSGTVVKIVDFNFSQKIVLNEDGTEMDLLAAVSGTPAYTPPECLLAEVRKVAGRPLDVWALGVTLYAMLIGEVPFAAMPNMLLPELFESIIHEPMKFPEHIELSDRVKDLMAKLTAKSPSQRITLPEVFEHPWSTERSFFIMQ